MIKTEKSLRTGPSKSRLIWIRATTSLLFTVVCSAVSVQAQNSNPTVDSLASDLAALSARVAKLEGQITATDLVGTYALRGFQIELGGGNPAHVSSYVYVGTAVLAADGTATLTWSPAKGNTLTLGASPSVAPFKDADGGGNITSTWTYANGIVTISGFPPLAVAQPGRIAISASANNSDGTDVFLILMRLPDQQGPDPTPASAK